MKLAESNDIGFHQAFSFDGVSIFEHDDLVPEMVSIFDDGSGETFLEIGLDGWTPVTGHSGQHGYSGPLMHASEQFSPNVLDSMYRKYGPDAVYVLALVDDGDDPEAEVDTWIILRRD